MAGTLPALRGKPGRIVSRLRRRLTLQRHERFVSNGFKRGGPSCIQGVEQVPVPRWRHLIFEAKEISA